LTGATGLGIWIAWLATTLPSTVLVHRWDKAWVGFDVGEAIGLAATGVLVLRRSVLVAPLAAGTAALLIADAWFDTMTATTGLLAAGTLALAVELPAAILCGGIAIKASLPPDDRRLRRWII
jgi:hypothetical protein